MLYNETLRNQKERIPTDDGSVTLYSKEFNESYHSPKDGALNESLQKHVLPAFELQQEKTALTILDICYGLGYNTLATLYHVKTNNLPVKLHIISPEFDEALVRSLKDFDYPTEFDILQPIIHAISNDFYYEDEQFKIEVMIGDARQLLSNLSAQRSALNANDIACDIIYQDAFSPKVNPLLWTREWFSDIRAVCQEDAVLTTYSTAAATRMGLYENGFVLHYLNAPNTRKSLIASPRKIDSLEWIDMELKKQRNPEGKSLKDADYL
jgi:tRNA U34 5-methylaminomethyl-2-thiouridine-forming methyltransferase MnmC